MKIARSISIVILVAALAVAHAQFNLGGSVSYTTEEIKQAFGTTFSLDAFSPCPLKEELGGNSKYLIGYNDSTTGQLGIAPRGTVLLPRLSIDGVKDLVFVKFATEANLPPDPKDSRWADTNSDPRGGYSYAVDTSDARYFWGYVSFQFMVGHRDNRQRLQLFVINICWTKGGNLVSRYQVCIQKAPDELSNKTGEEWFPYLRGFTPATARPEGQAQPQTINIPGQTVTQTAKPEEKLPTLTPPAEKPEEKMPVLAPPNETPKNPRDLSEDREAKRERERAEIRAGRDRDFSPKPEKQTLPPFGVKVSVGQAYRGFTDAQAERFLDVISIPEPVGKTCPDTVSKVRISSLPNSTVVSFESNRPFRVTMIVPGAQKDAAVHFDGYRYVCAIHDDTVKFDNVVMITVVQNGQSRTIRFCKEN